MRSMIQLLVDEAVFFFFGGKDFSFARGAALVIPVGLFVPEWSLTVFFCLGKLDSLGSGGPFVTPPGAFVFGSLSSDVDGDTCG